MGKFDNNFTSGLKAGHIGEEKVLKYIQKYVDDKAYRIEGNEKRFDIILPTFQKTAEIKTDCSVLKTGNIAIEYQNFQGKPSGICASTSDFWITAIGENPSIAYIKPTKIFFEFVKSNYHKVVSAGDVGRKTSCYLIKLNLVINQKFVEKLILSDI